MRECDSPRKTWKIINEKITNEGDKIADERVMAEAFANHFKKIGRDLVDQISDGTNIIENIFQIN